MKYRLKISSRIVLAIISFIVLSVSSSLIYFYSFARVAPSFNFIFSDERHFYFEDLTSIRINKGFWNIDVIASDSNYIKIIGGRKILNYYLISTQTATGITLSLSDSIKDQHLYEFDAKVYTNSLENINLESFANMRIDSSLFNKLNVSLKDESMLQMKDCRIEELNISMFNISSFESELCHIDNVISSMYDSSYAMIYSADNVTPLAQKGFSVLMSYDEKNEFSTNVSDSVLILSHSMPEYFDSLKWLMSFETVNHYSQKFKGEVSQVNYNYWEMPYKPRLSNKRHWPGFFLSFENRHVIFLKKRKFMDFVNVDVSLIFSRGLLNTISYSISEDNDSLHSGIVNLFNQQFGNSQDEQSEPFHFEYGGETVTHVWHDYKGRIGENFTKIVLRRAGKQIIIEIVGPYLTFEEDIKNRGRFWYLSWETFM